MRNSEILSHSLSEVGYKDIEWGFSSAKVSLNIKDIIALVAFLKDKVGHRKVHSILS